MFLFSWLMQNLFSYYGYVYPDRIVRKCAVIICTHMRWLPDPILHFLNNFIHTIISCLHTTYVQTWNTLLNNHKGKYESIDTIYKATTPSYSFYIVIDCILIPAHEATTNPDQQNWTKWICCTKFIHNVSIYTNRDDVGEYFMILWNNLMNCS